ncbi:MAG: DUF962 domain-containing protein [Kiloniellales bacterium]|nr:DUF962 domain-containing protein [Kiloniellales bacterium]
MTGTLFERQMAIYTTYHRDHRNRVTHFFGIPAIILAILFALAPVQVELGATTVSLAILVSAAVWLLWIGLDRPIGLAMGLFMVPALGLAEWAAATQSSKALWIAFALLFVGGWALQLLGHLYEGRRPALLSNLFQALIGPMFLVAEVFFALGLRRDLKARIERTIRETDPPAAGSAAQPLA